VNNSLDWPNVSNSDGSIWRANYPAPDLAPGGTGYFTFTTQPIDVDNLPVSALAAEFSPWTASLLAPGGQAINLNMPGGPFVPINANDDNGSEIVHEIPQIRDFNFGGPLPFDPGTEMLVRYTDPQLQEVDISVQNLNQLPGRFLLTASSLGGTGNIKMWADNSKVEAIGNATVYSKDTLPPKIYVEGLNPTSAVQGPGGQLQSQPDNRIRLTYIAASSLPVVWSSSYIDVTVTPVVTKFDMKPGTFDTVLVPDPANPNNLYVRGLTTAAGNGSPAGMYVDGGAVSVNLSGSLQYVQNAGVIGGSAAIVNSNGLLPGGIISTAPPNGINATLRDDAGNQYSRVLDRPGFGHAGVDSPVYGGTIVSAGDYSEVELRDFPSVALDNTVIQNNFAFIRGLTDIYIEYHFRTYLVWEFTASGEQPSPVIYTAATGDWSVTFDLTGVQGAFNLNNSSIGAGPVNLNDHSDPIVAGPDFNDLLKVH
jgi:hypothetical protein